MTRPTVITLAQRLSRFRTNGALEIRAQARLAESLGQDVIRLDLGEPDCPTPSHIIEAGLRALHGGATMYAPPAGIPELREAIAELMHDRGLAVGPEHIVVTSGSTPMLFYAITGSIEAGDEVLVPNPAAPIYDSIVHFAEGRPVHYTVDPSRLGGIDIDEIARLISPRTRLLLINTPHNPTGTVLDLSTLARLADLAMQHDLTVVSDEVYSGLVFGNAPPSIATLPGMSSRTIVVDGFSKTYAMAGWRLGYGVVPVTVARRFEHFVMHTTNCAPTFIQRAGLAALRGPQDTLHAMCNELRVRRDLFVAGLNQIPGLSCRTPRGTFYLFPEIAGAFGSPDPRPDRYVEMVTAKLLRDFGVACVPGTVFGAGGVGHLRLSFVTSPPKLQRALTLLRSAAMGGLVETPAGVGY